MHSEALVRGKNTALPAVIFVGGIAAGFLNGLLGCGGGIVIVTLLSLLTNETEHDGRDVFAASVAAILPMSAVSAVMYLYRTDADVNAVSPFILPAIAGGAVGALLLDRLPTRHVKKLFAALIVWAGVSLILKGTGIMK